MATLSERATSAIAAITHSATNNTDETSDACAAEPTALAGQQAPKPLHYCVFVRPRPCKKNKTRYVTVESGSDFLLQEHRFSMRKPVALTLTVALNLNRLKGTPCVRAKVTGLSSFSESWANVTLAWHVANTGKHAFNARVLTKFKINGVRYKVAKGVDLSSLRERQYKYLEERLASLPSEPVRP